MSKIKWLSRLPAFLVITLALTGCTDGKREEIVISMPYNQYIRAIDTNYYKHWLEEQTGLSIKFNIIYEDFSVDYLQEMFASGYVRSDALFTPFEGSDRADFNQVLQEFGEKGYILPLNDYVDKSVYLNQVFADFNDYDLREVMTSPDGKIYYMPGFDPTLPETHYQVLWLNQSWMKTLKLNIPQTPGELRFVLEAFKNGDPNGNGKQDEIPLSGSVDSPGEQCYDFIINAFVYNDPDNSRLFVSDGEIYFAPVTDEWRQAMQYLNRLYEDGLLSPFQFTMGHQGLRNLVNDPWNVLGGFTSRSITDVIFHNNPQILHNFVHTTPLAGTDGIRRTTVRTPLPKPAGLITARCKNPDAVFKLFDLMLSEQAFLIGRYGRENTDWIPAQSTDVDFYGRRANVKVINQLWSEVQNTHLREQGPFYAYRKYADGTTFSANDMDPEYIDARAYRIYELFKPKEYIKSTPSSSGYFKDIQSLRQSIDAYTAGSIRDFITGRTDPFDDTAWEAHLNQYQKLGVENLIRAARTGHAKD